MRHLVPLLRILAAVLLGRAATGQDVFVVRGIPHPLERDPSAVVVQRRTVGVGPAEEGVEAPLPGAEPQEVVAGNGSLDLLEIDPQVDDVDLALDRLRADPGVVLAAPLYRGAGNKRLTVLADVVVKFRPGVDEEARVSFFGDYGMEPLYEYPAGSGRVVCQVTGGQRERDTLSVVVEAYFDERVEHVSPMFLQEVTLTGDCYDSAFQPGGGCTYMGPSGIDCPPVDSSQCLSQPPCPPCACSRFPMALPTGCGDDEYSCEMHQFDAMGIWDAWAYTRGSPDTRILILDNRLDRDHRDVKDQVALELEPDNARNNWKIGDGASYSVTLQARQTTPAYIYFYFVEPPNDVVSGSSLTFHIDNLRIQETGPAGAEKARFWFDDDGIGGGDDDLAWQSAFSVPAGDTTHTFERKTVVESGCPASAGLPEEAPLGTHLLRIQATGAGDQGIHQIRVAVPGLEAGKAYYITANWIPHCNNVPPFEGFVRFGIDGDQGCAPHFGGEMGRNTNLGEVVHGTMVTGLACGADNDDGYGMIGVAPDCKAIFVSLSDRSIGFNELDGFNGVRGDPGALLAGARADASVLSSSAQLTILNDDYLDAYRAVATRTRGGLGAPLALSAGNDAKLVYGSWIAGTELATSVGALALVTPLTGPPYWTRGCISSFGADIFVLDHRVFGVNKPWAYETYGFTTLDPARGDGNVPGDFYHFDEVEIANRRVKTSTSWCTPIVAGVYGLMLSRDPSLSREEAMQILYHTAKRPDAQGKINGVVLDCALPGNCLGGVDPSSGCAPYPTDPEDASYVSPAVDVPFDVVTSRSRVLGYGLLDAEAAVIACNPSSPKRWPEPPRAISAIPAKLSSLVRRVRVSWLPAETNRGSRGYDGYLLVRTVDAQLLAPPVDGTAPPALGAALHNGTVVAKGDATAGTLGTSYEDTSTTPGRRHYAIFYYRKMAGPQEYYYSFGKEARIIYSSTRWKTVTTQAALVTELSAGLVSDDPAKAVVLFVDSAAMSLTSCVQVGATSRGSPQNGPVWIVGDKGLGSTKTKLVVPAGQTGLAVCGSRHLIVSGFTVEGGDIGLGVWKPGGAQGGCASCDAAAPRADEIAVLNCRFEANQIGLWLENAGDVLVQNCVIRQTGAATHANASGIYFPPRPDPNATTPNDYQTLYSILNNTIDVAGRPALRIHMKSLSSSFNANHRPRVQIFNNILRATGSGGVCVEHLASAHYHLSNWNDFVNLAPAQCGRIVGGASYASLDAWRPVALSDKQSISADPLFVNVATGDYHLQGPLSPAANGGTTEVYEPRGVPFDFDGWDQPRVYSGSAAGGVYRARSIGVDIGADELKASQASDADLGYPFVRGDANNDGSVQLSDASYLLNHLFSGGPPPVCFDAADADDSELLDITDSLVLFQYLFDPSNTAFSSLPPPSPFCGFDTWRWGAAAAPNQGPYHCGTPAACP